MMEELIFLIKKFLTKNALRNVIFIKILSVNKSVVLDPLPH